MCDIFRALFLEKYPQIDSSSRATWEKKQTQPLQFSLIKMFKLNDDCGTLIIGLSVVQFWL